MTACLWDVYEGRDKLLGQVEAVSAWEAIDAGHREWGPLRDLRAFKHEPDVSPYLLLPTRTQAEVERERIAEGRHPITGEELPWEDFDGEPSTDKLRELAGMYVSIGGDEP